MRNSAGSRPTLGEAVGGRRKTKVRLAQRQIWPVLASRPVRVNRAAPRQGSVKIEKRHGSDDADGEARHRKIAPRLSRGRTIFRLNINHLSANRNGPTGSD